MSKPDPGLFVTKGMTVSLPDFSLGINENGEMILNKMTFHLGLDMCSYWIEIAYEHLIRTEDIHRQLIAANNTNDEPLMGELLQMEFMSGMQSIMAGCISIDSYYASIKEFAEIPESVKQAWKEKGTARYKQIAETLKSTFTFPHETSQKIRDFLKQSFGLRDMAVHPKNGTDKPVIYPEINKISDWRYSAFRFTNAKAVVEHSLKIVYHTASQKQSDKKQALNVYCENLVKKLEPTLSKWDGRYGQLL